MKDCCYTCENLEYRKDYVYPYRCLKHKGERFSEKEIARLQEEYWMCDLCMDYKRRQKKKTEMG